MWQPRNAPWWCLVIVSLLVVFVWPPRGDRSLAAKVVNWAVDPFDELPVLPGTLRSAPGARPWGSVEATSAAIRCRLRLQDRG
jgi:hypothetical protein